jgi:hypothetical protein
MANTLPATAKPIPADLQAVLDRIAEGGSVTGACGGDEALRHKLYAWGRRDPAFRARLEEAEADGAEAMADRLQNIHTEIRSPLMARVVSDNLRWIAGHRSTRYATKAAPADEDADNPRLLAVLTEAIARIPRPRQEGEGNNMQTIEAERVTEADIFGE